MFGNRRLMKHIIATIKVLNFDLCELQCYHQPNCVSINFNVISDSEGLHECELSNATHRGHENELMNRDGYIYKGAEVRNLNLLLTFSKEKQKRKKTSTKTSKTLVSWFMSLFGRFMFGFGYEFMFSSDKCSC